MEHTAVTNMPTAALWVIAGAMIVFALSSLIMACVAISILKSLKDIFVEIVNMLREVKAHLPRLMKSWERP